MLPPGACGGFRTGLFDFLFTIDDLRLRGDPSTPLRFAQDDSGGKIGLQICGKFVDCLIVEKIVFRFVSNKVAGKEYSSYQRDVISRYYDNLDAITLARLQELVGELYLADSEAKRARLWERAQKAMVRLKIAPAIIEHIMNKKDVTVLAKNIKDWLAASRR